MRTGILKSFMLAYTKYHISCSHQNLSLTHSIGIKAPEFTSQLIITLLFLSVEGGVGGPACTSMRGRSSATSKKSSSARGGAGAEPHVPAGGDPHGGGGGGGREQSSTPELSWYWCCPEENI